MRLVMFSPTAAFVLAFALSVGLSDANAPLQVGNSSADCQQLRLIHRLARIEGTKELPVIEATVTNVCSALQPPAKVVWSNNRAAKLTDGRWRYPDGSIAVESDGRLRYPDVSVAKEADGRWRYPNVAIAREADGRWRKPNVSLVTMDALVDWACEALRESPAAVKSEIRATATDDERHAMIIELAWRARLAGKGVIDKLPGSRGGHQLRRNQLPMISVGIGSF